MCSCTIRNCFNISFIITALHLQLGDTKTDAGSKMQALAANDFVELDFANEFLY